MLVTNDEELFKEMLVLRDHGRQPGGKMFWNTEIGWKYKMSSMQAALGLAQLERIDELVEKKREIFNWYYSELDGIKGLTLNYESPNTLNTYWMVTVIIDKSFGIEKEEVINELSGKDIDSRPIFYPLSSLPAYNNKKLAKKAQEENHVSYALSPYGINVPCGLNMTKDKVIYVCNSLKTILKV